MLVVKVVVKVVVVVVVVVVVHSVVEIVMVIVRSRISNSHGNGKTAGKAWIFPAKWLLLVLGASRKRFRVWGFRGSGSGFRGLGFRGSGELSTVLDQSPPEVQVPTAHPLLEGAYYTCSSSRVYLAIWRSSTNAHGSLQAKHTGSDFLRKTGRDP